MPTRDALQKKRAGRIDLAALPEMKNLTIIRSQQDIDTFLSKLRQDWYSRESEEVKKFLAEFDSWMRAKKRGIELCFAIHDEPDDFAKNDNWGHYMVYKCLAVRDGDGRVHVIKSPATRFSH